MYKKQSNPYKIYLNVPYVDKEKAKLLGALWDPEVKKWYAPNHEKLNKLMQWK